jgi:hypothetical protein
MQQDPCYSIFSFMQCFVDRCLSFCPFLYIVSYILSRLTNSDYPFGVFNIFLLREIPNQKYKAYFVSWLNWYFSRHIGCTSINFAMHKNDILMIRIGIIGSNAKQNNKEYVDFIVCKRIASVNIINRNTMQLCVYYVQVHVYFSVLVNLIQSLLLTQKSQFFRHYIASRYHTILTRLFFKMFSLHVLEICEHM